MINIHLNWHQIKGPKIAITSIYTSTGAEKPCQFSSHKNDPGGV
jgi:hypothetical protein